MRNRRIFAIATTLVAAIMLVGCATITDSVAYTTGDNLSDSVNTPRVVHALKPVDNSNSEVIRSCNREPGSGVLLSFDDGGTPEQVASILKALYANGVQAAFLPTGDWALEHLDLIDQMKIEGHIVGNHTQTHAPLGELSATNPDEFYAETFPLEGVANTDPMWLRPPYEDGAYDELVRERLTEKDVQICTWTADTHDWAGDTVDQMMNRLIVGDEFSPVPLTEDGMVLMHLHTEHAAEMVGAIVKYLESKDIKVASLTS